MTIKIREGSGVTELTENKGIWRTKRNGARLTKEQIDGIIKAVGGR